ncbi:MAG: two-component system, cell cycle response regulator [Pseudomonadota bacterium]|nr:two-component system, cell cycle response regulator [Pseudomonadota bacterium]
MPFGPDDPSAASAHLALTAGQPDKAAALAHEMLASAKRSGRLPQQARAFLLLAWTELHQERIAADVALSHARQAAHLFHLIGDVSQESAALALVAQLLTQLGCIEESIENATLAVQLAESQPAGRHTAIAYHHLGVATLGRDSQYARRALLRSVELARQHLGGETATAQPRLQLLLSELHRLELCRQSSQPAQIDPLALETLARLRGLQCADPAPPALLPQPGGSMLQDMLPLIETGLGAFLPPTPLPPTLNTLQDRSATPLDRIQPPALRGLAAWMFARRALERDDVERAGQCIADLLDCPQARPEPRLLQTAHHLRIELLERQGRHAEALAAFRRLRSEQLQQDRENMASRERNAALRLAWRRQSRALAELRHSSRQFERLSLEDPLTGLANRRQVERITDDLLQRLHDEREPASPWCLVMIDIDRFKQINDCHTHVVGDEVLRAVAQLLRHVLRRNDLAARLAGDEFVLILPCTGAPVARQVIERLRGEIARHDWSALSPGLAVTASLGLAEARPDDTLATLMQRSDLEMYTDKAHRAERTPPARAET